MENKSLEKKPIKRLKERIVVFVLLLALFQLVKYSQTAFNYYSWFYHYVVLKIQSVFQAITNQNMYLILTTLVLIVLLRKVFSSSPKMVFIHFFSTGLFLINFFLIVWGLNYARPTIKQEVKTMNVDRLSDLKSQFELKMNDLVAEENPNLRIALASARMNKNTQKNLSSELKGLLLKEAKNLKGHQGKMNFPRPFTSFGGLRKMGISGVYFPYTGEPLYDSSLPLLRKYFTYAHEFFHGRGVTGEDECNYLAWRCLANSDNPIFQYCAYFDSWYNCVYQLDLDINELDVNQEFINDIKELKKDSEKYKTWFHKVSHLTNDTYIKLLGEPEGVKSYDSYLKWI